MSRADMIRALLTRALQPVDLEIEDESHLHAGHNPDAAAGGTHFRVRIVSEAFAGQRMLARHRRVNELLAAEFAAGLHALSLTTKTPDEAR